jgi:putative cell wall-binding protein
MHANVNSGAAPAARWLAAVGALVLALALLAAAPPALAQTEDDRVTPARVEGANRFETAANIARLTYSAATHAIIVTGQDFPDALAASYAAGQADGPLLLVARDMVPQVTWDVLSELGVTHITVVGGLGTISGDVERALMDAGYETVRAFGQNRYQTSAAVARAFAEEGRIGTVAGEPTAILASGEDYPDALAAGPLAAGAALPLFLTPHGQTTEAVNSAIADLGIRRLIIVGGEAAVSSAVEQAYRDAGYTVERIAGQHRMATAVLLADAALVRFGFSVDTVLLARGNDYPDALAASVHGAAIGAPILLAATPTTLSAVTEAWFQAACPHVDAVRALGGTAAVSESTLAEAIAAAESCEDEQPPSTQDYIVAPQEEIHAQPGYEREWTLIGDYDVPPGQLALFPCDTVTFAQDGVVFNDADEDGFADAVGHTDTDEAWVSRVNGAVQTEGTTSVAITLRGGDTWHTQSNAEDCAIPVVWEAGPHDGQLPVGADGIPTVRYGAGYISWSNS